MNIKSPCMNCPKKGCGVLHNKCNEYIKYKEEIEAIKKANDIADIRQMEINRYFRKKAYYRRRGEK